MASETESDEEVMYPSDGEEEAGLEGAGAADDERLGVPPAGAPSMSRQVSYTVVAGINQVLQLRAQMIGDVVELGLDEQAATDLLATCKWSMADAMEGLLHATASSSSSSSSTAAAAEAGGGSSSGSSRQPARCLVCDDSLADPAERDLGCGHAMCGECWTSYLDAALLNRGEVEPSS
jgi:hypothetical protein